MKKILSSLIAVATLLAALPTALAVTETDFNLRQGQVNATWKAYGSVTITPESSGIRVQSTGTGMILAAVTDPFQLPQAGVLSTSSAADQSLDFVWNDVDEARSVNALQMPLALRAGNQVRSPMIFPAVRETRFVTKIGFAIPASTDIVIHDLAFGYWNIWERIGHGFLSFWTFDRYRPYHINFVWGPEIVTNPIQKPFIYEVLPPPGYSGTLFVYQMLLLSLVIAATLAFFSTPVLALRKRRLVRWSLTIFLCGWLLMDARMGSEFLSWMHRDYAQYIAAPMDKRMFRDRSRFYDFADFAAPFVSDRKSYVFYADHQWPFLGNIRYITYPALPGDDAQRDDTWVIYNRPDVTVSDTLQLTLGGQAISLPGSVLGRFDAGSFVFRVKL